MYSDCCQSDNFGGYDLLKPIRNLTSFPSSTGPLRLPISQVEAHKQAMSTLAARQQPRNSSFPCHLQSTVPENSWGKYKIDDFFVVCPSIFHFLFGDFQVPWDSFRECGAFLRI